MIKSFFKRLPQTLFGCALLFFAINKVFALVPLPEKEGFAKIFLDTLEHSHYMMPLIAALQLLAGLSLLSGRFVPLALLALLPLSVNIFLFHLFHDRGALAPACAILGGNLMLIAGRLSTYKALVKGG